MIYDCIVIGGGAAGSAAAFTLAKADFRVLLIDRIAKKTSYKIGESLSGQGIQLLKKSGLIEQVKSNTYLENPGDLSSWGTDDLILKDFIFSAYGSGWHLDRVAFDKCLQEAAQIAGAKLFNGHVRKVSRIKHLHWVVHLADMSFQARWLIDAGGRHGAVSRSLGIKRIRDKPLIAVHSWGQNRSSEPRTLVEAVSAGWWYTAQLPNNRRVVAMHTTPEHARSLLQDPRAFKKEMANTIHLKRYCSFNDSWERPRGVDASGSMLAATGGEDWMAIGDAAMTFDPLSSHGILNALAHGIFGAEAIMKALGGSYSEYESLTKKMLTKRQNYINDMSFIYSTERRWKSDFWKRKIN
ncbi:tryptophan 7-halogenase [Ochrobactrum sp. CM-21-5]|nr:FAD-dependent monooxygenase [Ochrobactrum sp. CM-21-5]MBC2886319.1 tryptophan 7-halogenase [Ochrobactrum sp. CM-21-5]